MIRVVRVFFVLLLSTLLWIACKPGSPIGILSESDMEDVLYDYHLAQAAAECASTDNDKLRYLYVQSVFLKHGITEADFDSSMVWYSGHSLLLDKIYERLSDRFNADASNLGVGVTETERMASMSEVGDTANIWPFAKVLFLRNDPISNVSTFSISADSTFLPGDTYKLSFYSHFLSSSSARLAFAFLTVNYKDGSVSTAFTRVAMEGSIMIIIPKSIDKDDKETENISITFYYPLDRKYSDANYFFISSPALIRMHDVSKEKEKEKTEVNDSTGIVAPNDSITADSVAVKRDSTTIQPKDLLKQAPVERQINVVKEKQYNNAPVRYRRRRR